MAIWWQWTSITWTAALLLCLNRKGPSFYSLISCYMLMKIYYNSGDHVNVVRFYHTYFKENITILLFSPFGSVCLHEWHMITLCCWFSISRLFTGKTATSFDFGHYKQTNIVVLVFFFSHFLVISIFDFSRFKVDRDTFVVSTCTCCLQF